MQFFWCVCVWGGGVTKKQKVCSAGDTETCSLFSSHIYVHREKSACLVLEMEKKFAEKEKP